MKLKQEELVHLIQCLIGWDALELSRGEDGDILIPYLMNDGTECFLRLTEAVIQGPDMDETLDVTYVEHQEQSGLILPQQSGNVVTVWFKDAQFITNCYQYHLIGHQWRKMAGEEWIRRLVNLICVLHDKKTYLGEMYCRGRESLLASLAEFPPVLYYTPINESILDWYPDTIEGILAAEEVADFIGDEELAEEIRLYRMSYKKKKSLQRQMMRLVGLLGRKEHAAFWNQIFQWMKEESLTYPVRDYGEAGNRRREETRSALVEKYRMLGYEGDFPYMEKQDRAVIFYEEQPFTVLEEEDYKYQVFAEELNV